MNHQGVVYRGYFESFGFTENAQTPGLFEYSIRFVAYAKLGERYNFMPWHRTPHEQSNSSSETNFSFLHVDVGNEEFLEPEETPYARVTNPPFTQSNASKEFIKNNEGRLRSITGRGPNLTER